MTYEEAKKKQVDEFRKGNYFVLREDQDALGSFQLVPAANKYVAQESIVKDAIAVVKKFPTKLRMFPGGKN